MPTRRRTLLLASALLGGTAAAATLGYEMVESGHLPGKSRLDQELGRCAASVPGAPNATGPVVDDAFDSALRRTRVAYRLVYPPGAKVGDRLPVCLVLHGFTGTPAGAIDAGAFDRHVAARVAAGRSGCVLAAPDGGLGYWHPHQSDDPLGMVLDEFVPLLAGRGLAAGDGRRIGVLGTSMGGYGALLCAISRPALIAAAVGSSPAIWRSYQEARKVNGGAFDSAAEWAKYDLFGRVSEFSGRRIRIDCGDSDPFAPAVRALRGKLPDPSVVTLGTGCHDGSFWQHAAPAEIDFICDALAADQPH